jgi:AcrR family transcriptional regulator
MYIDPSSVETRVHLTLLEQLVAESPRRLRSRRLAAQAGITESNLFRHFPSMTAALETTIDWAWKGVLERSEIRLYEFPRLTPEEYLMAELRQIWSMAEDEQLSLIAFGAFGLNLCFDVAPADLPSRSTYRLRFLNMVKWNVQSTPFEQRATLIETMLYSYMTMFWNNQLRNPTGTPTQDEIKHYANLLITTPNVLLHV